MNNKLYWFWIFGFLFVSTHFLFADKGTPSPEGINWADSQHVAFEWLTPASNVSNLVSGATNDAIYSYDLPFTFYYYNQPFTRIYISTNGFITFHNYSLSYPLNNDLNRNDSPDSLLALFWDDLQFLSTSSGEGIYVDVQGDAPYRKIIITFVDPVRRVDLSDGPFKMQIVLFETTNLIKYQYLQLGNLSSTQEQGSSATVGLKFEGATFFDSLLYSYNQPSLSDSLAILFYPAGNLTATTTLSPSIVEPGVNNQEFTLTVSSLTSSAANLNSMGKADVIRIANPINTTVTDPIVVTEVYVDGVSYYLKKSTSPPSDYGFATWYYDNTVDSLYILLPPFAMRDSARVVFAQDAPQTTGSYTYTTDIYARLEPSKAANATNSFNVEAATISYYTFTPASAVTMTAGGSQTFVITAYDQFGNTVPNNESITVTVVGGDSAKLNRTNPISFGGNDTVQVRVSDTKAESFTLRAENINDSNVNGESGLITVQPASPDHFVILSSQSAITVGTSRLLQAQLVDVYGNPHPDSTVIFQRFNGTGTFSNSKDSIHVVTNSSGVGEATYTASTQTSYIADSIQVSWNGTVLDTIVLPLEADAVSYYEFSPSTDQTTTAGTAISFTVTARDIYGNAVANSDQIQFTALNATGATFTPGSTLSFGGASAVNISVTDTVVETIHVRGEKVGNSNINGQSGAITVNPAPAARLQEITGSGSATVGSNVLIRVKLLDQYANALSDSTVKFRRIRGSGTFVSTASDTVDVITDASGIAETNYTASQSTANTPDSILVYYGTTDSIYVVINLQPAEISYYTIEPLGGVYTYIAGDTITLNVTAYDAYDNVVTTATRQVTLSSNGSGIVYTSSNPTYLNSGTATFTVVDTVKESGITFTITDTQNKSATSSTFTINAGALKQLTIRSDNNNGGSVLSNVDSVITADDALTLYAAGYDQYGNYIADIDSATWTSTGGLQPAVNATGRRLIFEPTTSEVTGKIVVEISGNTSIQKDSTGTITVNDGALRFLYIQTSAADGGTQLGDTTIASGDTIVAYAVGYDADQNYIGLVNSNWTPKPTAIAHFDAGAKSFTGTTANIIGDSAGTGTINATSVDNSTVSDETGVITVNAGTASYIVIRDGANGGGSRYDQKNLTITTDTTITLYAAHYDANGNYVGDLPVTWAISSSVNTVPSGSNAYIVFEPQVAPDNFYIYTTSSTYTNDSTNTITLNTGSLSKIVIQDASGAAGNAIDTLTLTAGQTQNLVASGYDAKDNYIADQASNWSAIPDSVGNFLTPNPTASNTFEAQKAGNTVIEAVLASGSLSDQTSTITVKPGDPSTLTKVAETDSQTASPGTVVPKDLEVVVKDAQGNRVPNITVTWNPVGGGTVSPTQSQTNANGVARTTWTLHTSTATDSVKAYIATYTTTPDTVTFYAFPTKTSPDTLVYASATSDTGAVLTSLQAFRVQVLDSLNNPVPNTKVNFSVTDWPDGASGFALSTDSAITDANGYAATTLTLGNKVGTYRVSAFANTTPGRLDFTGVANQPAAANAITVIAGDAQTDTVGQALPTDVKVQVVDAYGNAIANYTVVFEPVNGGSVSPATTTSDANGYATTTWTLGNTIGTYKLVAKNTAGTIVSDTLTATAINDAPAQLTLISIRNVSSDSVTVLATEATPFVVKLTDQYGNRVADHTISFAVQSGTDAVLTRSTAPADSNGLASNSVRVDPTSDLTVVNAYIANIDTLPIHFYKLQYVSGSLSPDIVGLGSTQNFQIQVRNPGPRPVLLDTNASYLTFTDGTVTISTYLLNTDSIPANNTTTLTYDPVVIDNQLTIGRYTPKFAFTGKNADSNFKGNLESDPQELRVYSVEIVSVTTPAIQVERGNTFDVTMTLRNAGNVTINVDTANTRVVLKDGSQNYLLPFQYLNVVTTLGPDQTASMQYRLTVPENFPLGSFQVDGYMNGTIVENGQSVSDSTAGTVDTIRVISGASLAYVSNTLSPIQVTRTLPFQFSLKIQNSGMAEVTLDSSLSYMAFGSDTFYLDQDQVINGNSTVTLTFENDTVVSTARTAKYPITLYLQGMEGQAAFVDTLRDIDSVRVQNPISLVYSVFNTDSTEASQGESGIPLTLTIENTATLGATAIIQSFDDIIIKSADTVYTTPVTPAMSDFPISIPAGGSQTITLQMRFHDTFPTGVQNLWGWTIYADSNANQQFSYQDSTTQIDSIRILKKTDVQILSVRVVGNDTVSQGQSGVTFHMVVENSGEVAATVGADSAYLSFNNQHTLESVTPALPTVIAAGASDTLVFKYTINSQAALGTDPVSGHLLYRNARTLSLTTTSLENGDSLYIESAADTNLVTINSVTASRFEVNQGQTGIEAQVKLTNLAQADARIDSLRIVSNNAGIRDSLITALGVLPGKSSKVYTFQLSVSSTADTGIAILDAKMTFTDVNSSQQYADSGAAAIDSLDIQIPGDLEVNYLAVNEDTVSRGQTGVIMQAFVKNTGEAPVTVTDATPYVLPSTSGFTFTRVAPENLPTIAGKDSVKFIYQFNVGSSAALGVDTLNLQVTGQDNNDNRTVGPVQSAAPQTLLVQTAGSVVIDSVRTLTTTASVGQANIPIRVYFHNPGQALVDVTDVKLYFNGSTDGFFQQMDSLAADPFTGSNTAYFSVEVLNSATSGSYSLTATVTGRETNLETTVQDSSVASEGNTLTVTRPAVLEILSVQAQSATFDFDSVSIGSKGVPVQVRVKNSGEADLLLDSLSLTFSSGIFSGTDTVFSPALQIAPGAEQVISFAVDVDTSNTSQTVTINARGSGRDANANIRTTDSGADTTDSWQMVTPAEFVFQSITPSEVSNGQVVAFTVNVQNTGEANTLLQADSTALIFGSEIFLLAADTRLNGNTARGLLFTAKTINLPVGTNNGILEIFNYHENGFSKSTSVSPIPITVYDSARVEIQTVAAPDTVSQDQTFDITVTVFNNGANNADGLVDSLVIPEFNIHRYVGQAVGANATLTLPTVSATLDTGYLGSVPYTVQVKWRDANINHVNVTDSARQVTVLKKAGFEVVSVLAPDTVLTGQTVDSVRLDVRNTGQAWAVISKEEFFEDIGVYTITAQHHITAIAPGDTVSLYYQFVVDSNSATGIDSVDYRITGKDSLSGLDIIHQVRPAFSWRILSAPTLTITSITAAQNFVSRGQTGVPVQVIIRNIGGTPVQLDTVRLTFANGDSNYTNTIRSSLSTVVQAGDTAVVSVYPDISATAVLGTDIINGVAVGRETVNGTRVAANGTDSPGSWTVEQRPQLQYNAFAVNSDTASTGQTEILVTLDLQNGDGTTPTAEAIVDSIVLLANNVAHDSANFVIEQLFSTPMTLSNGEKTTLTYKLTVQDTATSATYTFSAKTYFRDKNDDQAFSFEDASATDDLTVVQKAQLVLTTLAIAPDTAAIGQEGVEYRFTVNNTGEAAADILSNTLDFYVNDPFTTTLKSPSLPYRLKGGQSVDIVYDVNVPTTIALAQYQDTLIYTGSTVKGQDVYSEVTIQHQADSLNYLTVVNPADNEFVELGPKTIFDAGDTVAFTVTVTNVGGSVVHLNANTTFEIPSDPVMSTPIDTVLSDMVIAPAETTTLVFQPLILNQTGEYVPVAKLRGTANTVSYSENINTVVINIGGNVSITEVQTTPDEVSQGQKDVNVYVRVTNAGPPLQIDSAGTKLDFRYVDTGESFFPPNRRVDGLDSLQTTPEGSFETLHWLFDVPEDARTGRVTVKAIISFNNGTLVKTSLLPDTFLIKSGILLSYKNASINPDSVVPGQPVTFTVIIDNSGNTDLIVDPDSSYLTFTDGTNVFQANVDGNVTVRGTNTTTPRSNTVPFVLDTIPPAMQSDRLYPITIVMHGTLPNDQPFEGDTLNAADQLAVLPPALVVVDSIDVLPTTVTRGQSFVEIRYYLRNAGKSPAQINLLTSTFLDSSGNDVADEWITVYNSRNMPFEIVAQDTAHFIRRFNVTENATLGTIYAGLTGNFNDVRKPRQETAIVSNVQDSVRVLRFSDVFVRELALTNAPNPPYLNFGQVAALRLTLANVGDDTLSNVYLRIMKGDSVFLRDTLSTLLPNQDTQILYALQADSVSKTLIFRAFIDSAFSGISGEKVVIQQPEDNVESVVVQQPTQLQLVASASDSSLSLNQVFFIRYQTESTGESEWENGTVVIQLPANYQLTPETPDSVQTIAMGNAAGFWKVRAIGLTTNAINDSITVAFKTLPQDKNTLAAVDVVNEAAKVPVRTDSSAAVIASVTIALPAGAQDGVLSTGQRFVVRDSVLFLGQIAPEGKSAEIVVPAGYAVEGASRIDISGSGTLRVVEWTVLAPGEVRASDTIRVINRGRDENTLEERSSEDVLLVQVVQGAELQLSAAISAPAGARDGELSTGQKFELRVQTSNKGTAALATGSRNQLTITLPEGYTFWHDTLSTKQISLGVGDSTIAIQAPVTPSGLQNIAIQLVTPAVEENTGQPVVFENETYSLPVRTVRKALLRTTVSGDTALSVGQNGLLVVRVENVGDASVVPDSVLVKVTSGSGVAISTAPIAYVKLDEESKSGSVVFPFQGVQPVAADSFQITIIDTVAQDANNNYPDTLVQREQPATFWKYRIEPHGAIQAVLAIDTPPGAQDSVVSTGQVFTLRADIVFQGSVDQDGRKVAIVFPASSGFQLVSDSLLLLDGTQNTATVYWNIMAPQDVTQSQTRAPQRTPQRLPNANWPEKKTPPKSIGNEKGTESDPFQSEKDVAPRKLTAGKTATISTPVKLETTNFSVQVQAREKNTGEALVVNTNVIPVTPQRAAQLKIVPLTPEVQVGRSQEFKVYVEVHNTGQAGTSGKGILQLEPGFMNLGQGESAAKEFTLGNQKTTKVTWTLVAPDSNISQLMRVFFKQIPADENSGQPAALHPDSNQAFIDVNMTPKRLLVSKLTDVVPGANYRQGEENVGVLGIALANPQVEDTLYVNKILVSVRNPQANGALYSDPYNLFSRVKVVSRQYFESLQKQKGLSIADVFATIALSDTSQNPISVPFNVNEDVIPPGEKHELIILVDIAPDAPNRNFVVGLDGVFAFQKIGNEYFAVDVTDSIGNPLDTLKNQVASAPLTTIPSDPDKAFGNYPNPFGYNVPVTKFVFYMEQPGDAELRIYNLLGELVWKKALQGLSKGLYDGRIQWNGRNERGYEVLNGVYLAILRVRYNNGQTKTFKTKVAYIK